MLASGRPHEQIHLNVQPDLHLLFAAGVAVVTGLLFGLAPALNAIPVHADRGIAAGGSHR